MICYLSLRSNDKTFEDYKYKHMFIHRHRMFCLQLQVCL